MGRGRKAEHKMQWIKCQTYIKSTCALGNEVSVLFYTETVIVLCCLEFAFPRNSEDAVNSKAEEHRQRSVGLDYMRGWAMPSLFYPTGDGRARGYWGVPSSLSYGFGQDAVRKTDTFLGARARAVPPDESDCYCCWKDKTRQLLGGVRDLG